MSHVNSNIRGVTYMLLALVALAGCSNQLEPAKKAIAGVEAAIAAAGPDAQKFIPDQIRQVTDQLAGLKAKLDAKD